jgi:hypothetical protein
MDLEQLADAVGRDLFARAQRHALAHAEGHGTRRDDVKEAGADDLEQVPHDLADLVCGDLDLAFTLYRAMPCYANLMYIGHWGISPEFWEHMRALVDDPDPRQSDPALYWLWCGAFEDDAPVAAEAWREMTTGAGKLRLRRLLDVSGPVPWSAKAPLLESLATQPEYRDAVRGALESAATDYFGQYDKAAAERLLDELNRRSSR